MEFLKNFYYACQNRYLYNGDYCYWIDLEKNAEKLFKLGQNTIDKDVTLLIELTPFSSWLGSSDPGFLNVYRGRKIALLRKGGLYDGESMKLAMLCDEIHMVENAFISIPQFNDYEFDKLYEKYGELMKNFKNVTFFNTLNYEMTKSIGLNVFLIKN